MILIAFSFVFPSCRRVSDGTSRLDTLVQLASLGRGLPVICVLSTGVCHVKLLTESWGFLLTRRLFWTFNVLFWNFKGILVLLSRIDPNPVKSSAEVP